VIARRVVAALGVAALVAGSAAGAGSTAVASPCPAAIVHLAPLPGVAGSLGRLPWVGATPSAQQLVGLLVYWPDEWRAQKVSRATIYTGGHTPAGTPNMKILWVFLAPQAKTAPDAGKVVIKGRRLDGPGKSWQQFVAISYSGQNRAPSYASIVDLPTAGCWQLDLRAGSLHGTTVFRAIGS
jgi:hypothetical protein